MQIDFVRGELKLMLSGRRIKEDNENEKKRDKDNRY